MAALGFERLGVEKDNEGEAGGRKGSGAGKGQVADRAVDGEKKDAMDGRRTAKRGCGYEGSKGKAWVKGQPR